MNDTLSERVVSFIANLIPLYNSEQVGDVWCARSLTDGTLIKPVPMEEGEEDAWVDVLWQGDESRTTRVLSFLIASNAIARYAELHTAFSHPKSAARFEAQRMAEHFTFKTGQSVVFDAPDADEELLYWLREGARHLGKDTIISLLKKSIGL